MVETVMRSRTVVALVRFTHTCTYPSLSETFNCSPPDLSKSAVGAEGREGDKDY